MADLKISELTDANLPLSGAEKIPLVQGGVTKKTDVSNVISNFTSALDLKEDKANKGVADGYAPLNGSTKIDSIYLPSFVDDVIEVADFASLPLTGETGKIYVTLDDNKTYRWSGTVYVEISPTLILNANLTDIETGTATDKVITAQSLRLISLIDYNTNENLSFGGTFTNVTGGGNTAFGLFAGDQPTARALTETTSIGYLSGNNNTGLQATAVGSVAGNQNTGDFLTAIGTNAGLSNTFNNVSLIGYNASADEVGQLVHSKDGTIMARFSTSLMTATRKWNLPNANGTFALTSDIKTIDGNTLIGSGDLVLNNAMISLNEGNGIGYVIKNRNSVNYGNIGLGAFDVSSSLIVSNALGATGSYSFASGLENRASGVYSHVSGQSCVASGINSRASGLGCTASGAYSRAEGLSNTASGSVSHAEGQANTVSGARAHGEGLSNTASGAQSHVGGNGNFARSDNEYAIGGFGTDYTPNGTNNRLLNIGNGTGTGSRADALTLLLNGNLGVGVNLPTTKLDVDGLIKTKGYTVATLPTGVTGAIAYVTDASAISYRANVTGGGANVALVMYDGTNWIYH